MGKWQVEEELGYSITNTKGVMHYANGDKYEGEWKDGNLHGKGIYYYKSGDKYDGEWADNKRNGNGKVN